MTEHFINVHPVNGDGFQYLTDTYGTPVWPLLSNNDHLVLEQAVKSCGGTLHRPDNVRFRRTVGRDAGRVVSLSDRTAALAELYAHLTKRQSSQCVKVHPRALMPGDVIIALQEEVTLEFLEELDSAGIVSSIGIVLGTNLPALRQQVLVKSALKTLAKHSSSEGVWLSAVDSVVCADRDGLQIITPEDDKDQVLLAIHNNHGFFCISSHSDGVDLYLHPSLTLCSAADLQQSTHRGRPPICIASGTCYRHNTAVENVMPQGFIVSPEAIKAKIVILAVCWAILPNDGAVDRSWGYFDRLNQNPSIGAVIGTWTTVYPDPSDLYKLCCDLQAGATASAAVQAINSSKSSKTRRNRMVIFGDPDCRLLPRNADPAPAISDANRDSRAVGTEGVQDLLFLRHCLMTLYSNLTGSKPDTAARKARIRECFERCVSIERGIAEGRTDKASISLLPTLLIDILKDGALFIDQIWSPTMSEPDAPPHFCACPWCGGPAVARVRSFRLFGSPSRHIIECARCGMASDLPASLPFTLKFSNGGIFEIIGKFPEESWRAIVKLGSPISADTRVWHWPAGVNGRPAPVFKLPEQPPPGQTRISALFASGFKFALFSLMRNQKND